MEKLILITIRRRQRRRRQFRTLIPVLIGLVIFSFIKLLWRLYIVIPFLLRSSILTVFSFLFYFSGSLVKDWPIKTCPIKTVSISTIFGIMGSHVADIQPFLTNKVTLQVSATCQSSWVLKTCHWGLFLKPLCQYKRSTLCNCVVLLGAQQRRILAWFRALPHALLL